ncbi:MAG: hypothetical protein PHR47_00145 [Candidatus Pacebacteria bacterium]|nr:hypothetical protein [Candidatus Paceibacterota bacterium]
MEIPSANQYENNEQEEKIVSNEIEFQEDMETLYPGLSETSKRLLGLKEFRKFSDEEERELFLSSDRLNAYHNLSTNTFPLEHKTSYKKGITRDIISKNLIAENILQNNLAVYLGSGVDIEYPLVLGARNIWLIDPQFQNNESKLELKEKIEKIIKEKLPLKMQDLLKFDFDFGSGKEGVIVSLIPKKYGIDDIDFPKNIGLVILFASQDANGQVEVSGDIRKNIIDGGYILNESDLKQINNKEEN